MISLLQNPKSQRARARPGAKSERVSSFCLGLPDAARAKERDIGPTNSVLRVQKFISLMKCVSREVYIQELRAIPSA
jgi:hypothetical protein